jgi:ANTAR domain-containing protein/GAF domain-containing protein
MGVQWITSGRAELGPRLRCYPDVAPAPVSRWSPNFACRRFGQDLREVGDHVYASEPIEQLAQLARELQSERSESDKLQRAVDCVVALVGGCDHAGISLLYGEEVRTAASSDTIVERGDALQYELGEGPSLDSIQERTTVISRDLGTDTRWPRWRPGARADLGVQSLMSLLLYTNARCYGALNLYSDRPDAYQAGACQVASVIAAQIAVALAASREIEQRGIAMANRTVIGQAEGILMERLGLNADQAFAFLRRVSQVTNRKLFTVCQEIIETRRLPRLDTIEGCWPGWQHTTRTPGERAGATRGRFRGASPGRYVAPAPGQQPPPLPAAVGR